MSETVCCGRSSKLVVIWPVVGSRATSPASFTSTPSPSSTTYSASSDPNGFSPCWATYTLPCRGASRLGDVASAVPTFADSGHEGASASFRPISSGLHAPRPLAADGEIAIPAGSVTTARFRSASARLVASSFWGRRTCTLSPLGELAMPGSAATWSDGAKPNSPQPLSPAAGPAVEVALSHAPGSCQESTRRVLVNGEPQEVGNVSNGLGGTPAGQTPAEPPPSWPSCRQCPRRLS